MMGVVPEDVVPDAPLPARDCRVPARAAAAASSELASESGGMSPYPLLVTVSESTNPALTVATIAAPFVLPSESVKI